MASIISNVTSAFGQTDLQTKTHPLTFAYEAADTVTANQVVAITTEGKVADAATNGTASLAIGVALDSAVTGDAAKVVVLGMAENVPAQGTIAAGALLKRSATTAGYVAATATPAAGEVLGVAINASAGGTVDVFVFQGT